MVFHKFNQYSVKSVFCVTLVSAIVIFGLQTFLQNPSYTGLGGDIGGGGYERTIEVFGKGGSEGSLNIKITKQQSDKQPPWQQSSPNPPISAASALRLADRFRKERFREHAQFHWVLQELSLTPLIIRENKWLWVARFNLVPKPDSSISASQEPVFEFYIMMDGSVIVPEDPDGFIKD